MKKSGDIKTWSCGFCITVSEHDGKDGHKRATILPPFAELSKHISYFEEFCITFLSRLIQTTNLVLVDLTQQSILMFCMLTS
jgi:hypothetical protein